MERKFCGKCGMLTSECTCGGARAMQPAAVPVQPAAPVQRSEPFRPASNMSNMNMRQPAATPQTTDFGGHRARQESGLGLDDYYIQRFDKIALTQGEVIVKQYHIGEFAKSLGTMGKGQASVIVTNKRIISKSDSETFGASSASLEEITLDSVAGVKNYYSKGYSIGRIAIAALAALIGLPVFFSSFGYHFDFQQLLMGLAFCAVAVYMILTCRKPSYLFSIYASSTGTAMEMGANLRGKVFNSQGNGIVFQYVPTEEAVTMMCEIGACIIDLKTKGDLAISAWKKE